MKNIIRNAVLTNFPNFYNKLKQLRYENNVLPREFRNHLKNLSKNDLVIDLGANIGMVTESLAKRGPQVIAFEPNTKAFSKLRTVANNYSNIEIRNEAAGIANQQTKLFFHKETQNTNIDKTQASSLLDNKPNISKENYELVNEIDFSEFIQSLNQNIELIKIDIEGYEIPLLNHMLDKKVIEKVNKIYVETHENKFSDLIKPTLKLKSRITLEGYEKKFFFDWH